MKYVFSPNNSHEDKEKIAKILQEFHFCRKKVLINTINEKQRLISRNGSVSFAEADNMNNLGNLLTIEIFYPVY